MPSSPVRPSLYRRVRRAVILGLLGLTLAYVAYPQSAPKGKDKGPRALGLLEFAPNGTARLIPIAILVGGKFYDAGAYKASPVPLALWSETVYEAESNGVSQGLFTVGGAVRAGNNWFADGKWQPAGSAPAKSKHSDAKPIMEQDEGPPKLRRPDAGKPQSGETPAHSEPPATPPQAKNPSPAETGSETPKKDINPATPASDEAAKDGSAAANDTDPNRPVLHRGKTETLGSTQPARSTQPASKPATVVASADKKSPEKKATQFIPAISDAGGPDPRPYAYDIKPDEDEKFRKKMLAMAAEAIQTRAEQLTPALAVAKPATHASTAARAAKTPHPNFDDVQFRAFDLWNTNEPVFVLSAKAQLPKTAKNADKFDLTYYVTLVAKADIYGDLRKLHTTVTDDHHLDQIPRLELIDAVDADGDGRGEFLFREISDVGSSWAVYRAGADQLFALFQGTPSGQ